LGTNTIRVNQQTSQPLIEVIPKAVMQYMTLQGFSNLKIHHHHQKCTHSLNPCLYHFININGPSPWESSYRTQRLNCRDNKRPPLGITVYQINPVGTLISI